MKLEEVGKILKEDKDMLLLDLNESSVIRKKALNLHSIQEYTINSFRPPFRGTLNRQRVYALENIKDFFSDGKITAFKTAVCKFVLLGTSYKDIRNGEMDYCNNNIIPNMKYLIDAYNGCGESKETMLVSRHDFVNPYVEYLGIKYKVSNFMRFNKKGKFKDIQTPIRTGEDKVKATKIELNKKNLSFGVCAAILDGNNDIPLIEALVEDGGLTLASPLAKDEVKKKVDYPIKSFEEIGVLASMLEA